MTASGSGSWYGWIDAGKETWLLGGVKRVRSSRFATREQAQAYVAQAVKVNTDAGRLPISWGETWSAKPPEIGDTHSHHLDSDGFCASCGPCAFTW